MESRTPKFTGLCLALYGIGAILVVYCGIQIKQQDLQYIPVAPFLSGVFHGYFHGSIAYNVLCS